jgi:hypothetical protein
MAIVMKENFKGFELEEGYTKLMYVAINFDSAGITANVYKYKDQAAREVEPTGNVLGGNGITARGVELPKEVRDQIKALVYPYIMETEEYSEGVEG